MESTDQRLLRPLQERLDAAQSSTRDASVEGASVDDNEEHGFVFARVGEQGMAIPILKVAELLVSGEVTIVSLPHVPETIAGIARLQGTLVPVVDMGRLLELGRVQRGGSGRLVVCRVGSEALGLFVDEVTAVGTRGDNQVQVESSGDFAELSFVSGVVELEDVSHLVCDPVELWQDLKEKIPQRKAVVWESK